MRRTVCAPLNQQGSLFISVQLSSKFTFITFSTDSIFGNSQQSRKQPNTNRSLVIVIIIIITDVVIIIMADVFSLSMQMCHFHANALLVGLAAESLCSLFITAPSFLKRKQTPPDSSSHSSLCLGKVSCFDSHDFKILIQTELRKFLILRFCHEEHCLFFFFK